MESQCENELLKQIHGFMKDRTADIDKVDIEMEASVLVPLVQKDNELAILFEVRSQSLKWQPGEICFPGGKVERSDDSFQATAVRETCEELNIASKDIKICGALDYLVTHLGPIVHPFVGIVDDYRKIKPATAEVEKVFYVPLKELLSQTPRESSMQLANKAADDFPFELVPGQPKGWLGRKHYTVYFYEYEGQVIWGLTARILHAFLQKIKESECSK